MSGSIQAQRRQTWLAYVGAGSRISVYHFDAENARFSLVDAVETPGTTASFMAFTKQGRRVYAANEAASGSVQALALGADQAKLTRLHEVRFQGNGPTHVAVDPSGRWLLAANYVTGSVMSLPIDARGLLGAAASEVFAGRQAHQVLFTRPDRFVVPCLGSQEIARFRLDLATGLIARDTPARFAVGEGGPRHLAMHPNRRWLYLVNETGSTLQAMRVDSSEGGLTLLGAAVSTLSQPHLGNTAAEVLVHPGGRFVYASNRGDDSIAIFALDARGLPSLVKTVKTGGRTPRHFSLDPSAAWMLVANQDSALVTVLAVVAGGGDLRLTEGHLALPMPQFVQAIDPH